MSLLAKMRAITVRCGLMGVEGVCLPSSPCVVAGNESLMVPERACRERQRPALSGVAQPYPPAAVGSFA